MDLVDGYGIECFHGHRFDLSKKGTLYLLKHGVKSDYDNREMWLARRKILQAGLFDGVLQQIIDQIPSHSVKILDIGCGEGTPLAKIADQRSNYNDSLIGFDISKEAINLATQQEATNFFCEANLAELPFNDQSFDVLIDILSPSSYDEFERVLKKDGILFKVIPNSNYLIELRHLLYTPESKNYSYSNSEVLARFKEEYLNYESQQITYEFQLNSELQKSLLKMTPLQWGKTVDLNRIEQVSLPKITVDFTLLKVCKNQ